jgi:hypothetical protein
MKPLRCRLGFHDFHFTSADDQFMPAVKVLEGKCSRCPEIDHTFVFNNSGKVVGTNHGLGKLLFGDYTQ